MPGRLFRPEKWSKERVRALPFLSTLTFYTKYDIIILSCGRCHILGTPSRDPFTARENWSRT
jgi:hypothetical protein